MGIVKKQWFLGCITYFLLFVVAFSSCNNHDDYMINTIVSHEWISKEGEGITPDTLNMRDFKGIFPIRNQSKVWFNNTDNPIEITSWITGTISGGKNTTDGLYYDGFYSIRLKGKAANPPHKRIKTSFYFWYSKEHQSWVSGKHPCEIDREWIIRQNREVEN